MINSQWVWHKGLYIIMIILLLNPRISQLLKKWMHQILNACIIFGKVVVIVHTSHKSYILVCTFFNWYQLFILIKYYPEKAYWLILTAFLFTLYGTRNLYSQCFKGNIRLWSHVFLENMILLRQVRCIANLQPLIERVHVSSINLYKFISPLFF